MAANTPTAHILRLPNELLLDIIGRVISPALNDNVRNQAYTCFRVTSIDACLDKYKDQMMTELRRFTACKKLYVAAKDVLLSRTKTSMIEAAYLLDYHGDSLYRIRGSLAKHRFSYENTENLNLNIRYMLNAQTGPVHDEPGYLLAVLERVLLKCTALKSINVQILPHAPGWFEAELDRMLSTVMEKLSKDGRQITYQVAKPKHSGKVNFL
ncbi:hypothetical protein PRZ48_008799 [Zasmidium cellare]|uniref:F-box domain-containing protein n=1 Tax=Zasmidium cellare TaxID=395010 RepID=A0ABR0EHI5_ZASCE|nr:hypothetical protein PRZ48_008799 [Zasmidium cellare]